jgi:V/A-type H+/Na+-transporting ATPase subunit D
MAEIKFQYNKTELENKANELNKYKSLFTEFPNIFNLKSLNVIKKKIAGVNIPILDNVDFEIKRFSLFNTPFWVLEGIEMLKQVSELMLKIYIEEEKIRILDYARKKTTQKVNLYEKVQIPSFENAILKIKRYLEDVDNLDKSSQKIVKRRLAEADGLF